MFSWYTWPSVLYLAAHYEMLRGDDDPVSVQYGLRPTKRTPNAREAWPWQLFDSEEAEAQRMGLSRIEDAEAVQIILDTNAYINLYHEQIQSKRGIWTIIDTDPIKRRVADLQVQKNKLAHLRYKQTGECTCRVCTR
jgi:hypothetical protein